MKQIVSYLRVSTQRQGASGLGLEAQRTAVKEYSQKHPLTEVAREYQEIESGRNNDRPILRQAIAHTKRVKGILVIAKLDRLARSVSFISNLMDSDIEFAACDLPEANRLLLHVMAAVSECEAKAISDRTIVALQAARARGTLLGAANPNCRNLTQEHRVKGAAAAGKAVHEQACETDKEILPIIQALRKKGLTLRAIAEQLSLDGYRTRKGLEWNQVQVKRILDRAA